jgi:hypothetical protein
MPDRWVVVSLDGLATAALGAYGSSWNETPAIDHMAALGTIWDRAIVSNDDSVDVLRALWSRSSQGTTWIDACRQSGRVELFLSAGIQANQIAALSGELGFDQCTLVESDTSTDTDTSVATSAAPPSCADDVETTALAKLLIPVIERLGEPGTKQTRDWSVLWVHGDSLLRCWDAPRWLFPVDEDQDEDMEEPVDQLDWSMEDFEQASYGDDAFAESREKPPSLFESTTVPFFELGNDAHPDLVTSWMQTYACQIRLVDRLLQLLLDVINETDGEIGLALIGTSGFSLGQNGWIGHRAGPIRSPQIHVPAISLDGAGYGIRVPGAHAIEEVSDWLRPLDRDSDLARISPKQWGVEESNPDVSIETQSRRADRVITTAEWFFVREAERASLYLKPDDRDDTNDVADRCREIVEAMESTN